MPVPGRCEHASHHMFEEGCGGPLWYIPPSLWTPAPDLGWLSLGNKCTQKRLLPQADAILMQPYDSRDWAVQQVITSANWGGVIGNFMTGGLNLQIEHHLFPAISFMHYPAIAKIVREECAARGVPYAAYGSLPEILTRFVRFMREVGAAEQQPLGPGGEMLQGSGGMRGAQMQHL
jgi:Fatty acid desaturase